MTMKSIAPLMLLATTLAVGSVAAEPLPATATKATMAEFKDFADGKTVDVVIFDLGVPVTATLVWSWKNKRITGDALVDGKDKIKVKTKLSFKGDKACADQDGKPSCHFIYLDGTKFHEVLDDGTVHATSTVRP